MSCNDHRAVRHIEMNFEGIVSVRLQVRRGPESQHDEAEHKQLLLLPSSSTYASALKSARP